MTIEKAFSSERLARYYRWANADKDKALNLYALNIAISEALYTPLNTLEIVIRNSIHDRMVDCYSSGWYSNPEVIIDEYQKKKVRNAISKLNGNVVDGKIVAELTFGFWTAMFNKSNNHLWGKILRPIFNSPIQRKHVAKRLNIIRTLRNRIAHHEPIIQRSLLEEYQMLCALIKWLSPSAFAWCNERSRFLAVHPKMEIIKNELVNPSLSSYYYNND